MKPGQANAGRKFRLYPSAEQAERLTAWGHTCRAIWNTALEQRQFAWEQRRVTLRAIDQCSHLTQARAELPWIADLPSQSSQQILRHLDQAYDAWWDPRNPAGAPKYKKRASRLAVPFTGQSIRGLSRLNRHWGQVWLPRVGWVRFRWSRSPGEIRNATVSLDASGIWHIGFGVHVDASAAPPNGKPGCGVDFGVACSAYVSDEDAPRLMASTFTPGERARKLGLERRKSRQITWGKKYNGGTDSNRLRHTLAELAKLRGREARRRQDFTHKLTTDLTKNHGWVGIEDLKVKNLTRSARGNAEKPGKGVRQKAGLNRAILDNAPYERRRQLAYKAVLYGSELRLVPPPYTSQTCAACGVIDAKSRRDCGRIFTCTACGHTAHADKNAALIIEGEARRAGGLNSTRRHIVPSPRETGRRMREPLAGVA